MQVTPRQALKAMAQVHGDESLVPNGKPQLRQNATECNASERIVPPKLTGEPASEASASGRQTGELTPQKMKAIALLVGGRSFAQTAAELGVDRTTVFRWRHEPAFAEELRIHLEVALDVVSIRTCEAMLKSSEIIAKAMLSFDEKIRVGSAFKVMNSKRIWDIGCMRAAPPKGE